MIDRISTACPYCFRRLAKCETCGENGCDNPACSNFDSHFPPVSERGRLSDQLEASVGETVIARRERDKAKHLCNLCGEPWPNHAAVCSYKVTAAENVRLREALAAYRSALRCGEPETEKLRSMGDAALARSAPPPPACEECNGRGFIGAYPDGMKCPSCGGPAPPPPPATREQDVAGGDPWSEADMRPAPPPEVIYVHSDGSACHHSESERHRRGCAAAIAVSPPAAEEEIVRLRQALQRCWDHGQTGGAIRKIVDEALGRNENG